MKLIQISDCHLFASPDKAGYGEINPADSLIKVLTAVRQQAPDALIFTGDLSGDDSEQSYLLFSELITQYAGHIAWRVIPGNHDNNPAFEAILGEHWLQAGSPWRLNGLCVHGMDSRLESTQGIVDEQQLTRIQQHIATHSEDLHILAIHHHPMATNSWMDKHKLHNTEALATWLAEQPVSAVLHGHIHAEHNAIMSDVPVLGVPSSSWQWQLSADFGLAPLAPGFRVIEWGNRSTLTTRVQRIN